MGFVLINAVAGGGAMIETRGKGSFTRPRSDHATWSWALIVG